MNLDHHQATHTVQKLAWTLKDAKHDFAAVEVAVLPPFTDLRSVQTLVDADKLELRLRRAGRLGARSRARTPARSRRCSWPSSASPTSRSGTRSAASTTTSTTSWSTPRCKSALGAGLTPILCVGEVLDVRKAGEHVPHTLGAARRRPGRSDGRSRSPRSSSRTSPSGPSAPARSATPEDAQELCAAHPRPHRRAVRRRDGRRGPRALRRLGEVVERRVDHGQAGRRRRARRRREPGPRGVRRDRAVPVARRRSLTLTTGAGRFRATLRNLPGHGGGLSPHSSPTLYRGPPQRRRLYRRRRARRVRN